METIANTTIVSNFAAVGRLDLLRDECLQSRRSLSRTLHSAFNQGGGTKTDASGRGGAQLVDESVVSSVRNYLRNLEAHGLAVRFGVIFGTQARGQVDRWSDIDLLVVSPRFDLVRSRSDIGLLWRVAARTDSRIEPIPCGELQWQEDHASPIVEIARREGQRVSV